MKRLINGETYNRALTGCSIPDDNGTFERGFNAGLNVAWNLLSVMPDELPEMKATVTIASHEPAVFGEWYKPDECKPDAGRVVLAEFVSGGMFLVFFDKMNDVWRHNTSGENTAPIARWCYLPEGLPF